MNRAAAVGLKKPDISILSDEFLVEVRGLPHRNLALEVLQKLLREEIKVRSKRHLVQARRILRRYGYPPDLQEHATKTVLEQGELLADSWAA